MSDKWKALLDEFRQEVPRRPERLPTFMEVAGYPHYENVCSNILAFFFDPSKPHGLGTLFLDALARVGGIKDQEGKISGNVHIHREKRTDAGNFIDILIQSDNHAILIENKIFAGTDYNPLDDYAKHLSSLQQSYKCKFLLTLKPVGEDPESEIGHGFRNITYEQFVHEIRGLLEDDIAGADTRYLTFMLDFLNTLDYLQGGMVMNPEFVKFLASRSGDVNDFLTEIRNFKDELRTKVTELGNNKLLDVASYSNVKQWKYRDKVGLFDILVHEIESSSFENKISVDTIIDPKGWRVNISLRGKSDKLGQEALKNLLQNRSIPFKEDKWFTLEKCFNYAEDLNKIAQVVQRVVQQLAK